MLTPPLSLTTTSYPITAIVPITIAPLPNFSFGVSLPQISIHLSTQFYTDSTATTTTFLNTLISTVNVSNTGAHVDFGVTMGISALTASPLREDDPGVMFRDEQDDFQNFF